MSKHREASLIQSIGYKLSGDLDVQLGCATIEQFVQEFNNVSEKCQSMIFNMKVDFPLVTLANMVEAAKMTNTKTPITVCLKNEKVEEAKVLVDSLIKGTSVTVSILSSVESLFNNNAQRPSC